MQHYIGHLIELVRNHYLHFVLNRKVHTCIDSINIVIGAAATKPGVGWIPTNQSFLDITKESDWEKLFPNNLKIDKILAEHVFEHIPKDFVKIGLDLCFKHLKNDGVIRIAVPDGYNPDPEYIVNVTCGGKGPGADDHRVLYNVYSLCELLSSCGFRSVPVEWFDLSGIFHSENYSDDNGKIFRSSQHGKPHYSFPFSHLSLIVDGYKEHVKPMEL